MRPLPAAVGALILIPAALAWTPVRAQRRPAADPAPPLVDWRGLYRMDESGRTIKRDKPLPENPVRELVQRAPYRIHVATSDGTKVTITDAYTLERWQVFTAGRVLGYAFSTDGYWLYVVHDDGALSSVAVPTGKASRMAKLGLGPGEVVVEVLGHGTRSHRFVTVVVARGGAPEVGRPCSTWRRYRRLRVRLKAGWSKATVVVEHGPHKLRRRRRRRGTSANTRYVVTLGRSLSLTNKIGGGRVGTLNRKPLPRSSYGLSWMRDSRGVMVWYSRPARAGCTHRVGLRAFRQPDPQRAAWKRQHRWTSWTLPDDVELVRGDLAHQNPSVTPDGMRVVGVRDGYPVLIEPVPRRVDHLSVFAPPTKLWPAVRPGVRALASGTGALRYAELLAEQGDPDGADRQLELALQHHPAPTGADVQRLRKRLAALRAVRRARAIEFGRPQASMERRRDIPRAGVDVNAAADVPAATAQPRRPQR